MQQPRMRTGWGFQGTVCAPASYCTHSLLEQSVRGLHEALCVERRRGNSMPADCMRCLKAQGVGTAYMPAADMLQ
jgi:hypothetical protein